MQLEIYLSDFGRRSQLSSSCWFNSKQKAEAFSPASMDEINTTVLSGFPAQTHLYRRMRAMGVGKNANSVSGILSRSLLEKFEVIGLWFSTITGRVRKDVDCGSLPSPEGTNLDRPGRCWQESEYEFIIVQDRLDDQFVVFELIVQDDVRSSRTIWTGQNLKNQFWTVLQVGKGVVLCLCQKVGRKNGSLPEEEVAFAGRLEGTAVLCRRKRVLCHHRGVVCLEGSFEKKKTALVSKDHVLCLLQEEEKGVQVLCLLQEEEKGVKVLYLTGLTDIKSFSTKRKKNVALAYLITYILEKKYNLLSEHPPDILPVYFSDASFRTLFSMGEGEGDEDEEGEGGEEATATPSQALDLMFYTFVESLAEVRSHRTVVLCHHQKGEKGRELWFSAITGRVRKDVIVVLCHHQEGEKGCWYSAITRRYTFVESLAEVRSHQTVVLCHHQKGEKGRELWFSAITGRVRKDVIVVLCHHQEGEKGCWYSVITRRV
ncbi:hypothetical protein M5K25_000707 [Dendrobium thyrsiflorum]|uniref:Uncharacterized protein n=1 Tax=Dendrobium thyrsiflorum TaxID=117978 RepID=A0ABD0VUY6_DENTH